MDLLHLILMLTIVFNTIVFLYLQRIDNQTYMYTAEDQFGTNKLLLLSAKLVQHERDARVWSDNHLKGAFEIMKTVDDSPVYQNVINQINSRADNDAKDKTLDRLTKHVEDELSCIVAVLNATKPNFITAGKETRRMHKQLLTEIKEFAEKEGLRIYPYEC